MAVTKFQRVYEAAIFKTLGASSRAIAAMLMVEYGLLGTLAGAVGSFGALALGWGISRYALDIPWRPVLHENRHQHGRDIAAHHDHRRRRERRCPEAQAACGAACRIVKIARLPMDVTPFKEMLLRKRGDILSGGGRDPLTVTLDTNTRQGDLADQATGNNEVHIQLKLKQTDAKILQAIEEALERIQKGTYGVCRDCGEPIAEARLNAIPWTRVCITCKAKQNS